MEFKDILGEKAFSKLENPEKPENTSIETLQKVGREKIKSLKNAIKEIDYLIKQREALSEKISNEVEKIKTEIENFLLKTEAVDSEGFKERSGLRQKQVGISELQLNEKVNCYGCAVHLLEHV